MMKHINIYEDYDLLRDLAKLGINEVKWDVDVAITNMDEIARITKKKLCEEDHEIANNWTYKNLRFVEIEGEYGFRIYGGDSGLIDIMNTFRVELNSYSNAQSTKYFTFYVRIDLSKGTIKNNKSYIGIAEGHTIDVNTGVLDMTKSTDYNKELIDGFNKNPIFPYILKFFESLL